MRDLPVIRAICGFVLLAGTIVLLPGLAGAQTVAFVSTEAIFERLPQAVEARDRLGRKQAEWLNEISTLERTVIERQKEIELNRLLWSPQERDRKETELRDLVAQLDILRRTKFGPNGEFETLYSSLMEPIIDVVMAAVRAEAAEMGYDFVFDKSTRGLPLLVANPDHDLTYGVLTRLGVDVDPSELKEREPEGGLVIPNLGPLKVGIDSSIRPVGEEEESEPVERRIDPDEIPMSPD